MPGQLLDGRVREGPDGQGVDVLADDPGEVGDALAAPQADVLVAEEDRVAAELGDRRLEADAGPQRGLLEDQAERPARPGSGGRWPLGGRSRFRLDGPVEQVAGLVGA